MSDSKLERNFWRYWLGGLLLLALMIFMNGWLTNDISPWGIRDHQSAGTALRVDTIQNAWQVADVIGLARFSIAMDLVYIGVYSFGVYCGGRLLILGEDRRLSKLGWLIALAAIILALTDYVETISQFVQIIRLKGSDILAQIAATAQPIKSLAFITTFFGIVAGLIFRRMTRRRA